MLVSLALLMSVACIEYDFQGPPPDVIAPIDTADPGTEPVDPTPVADAPVYANTSTELFEVDPETGVRVHRGQFHDGLGVVENMVDIAIDLDGRMFGGTYDAIYRIDPFTAAVTKVCDTELRPYALAFTSDGVLFAGAGGDISSIDLNTCAVHGLLVNSVFQTSGDLVGLPDGFLYWTVKGASGDELVRLDPNNGSTRWVGTIDAVGLFGLGYDADQLYGFSRYGDIVRVSPTSGHTTTTSTDDTISWWGATTNPVVW